MKRTKPAPRKKQKPVRSTAPKKARRRNSEPDAAEMYKKFHGRPSTKVTEFEEPADEPAELAELGKLLYLIVEIDGEQYDLSGYGDCKLCATADGGQLYLVAGRQALDLEDLGLWDLLPKDHVEIGEILQISYHTRKGFHAFEPVDYYHDFGEESGIRPRLAYDTRNKRQYIIGGAYQVKPEGIVD